MCSEDLFDLNPLDSDLDGGHFAPPTQKQARRRLAALETVRRQRRSLAPPGCEIWVSLEDVQRFAEQIGVSKSLASQAFNALVHCGKQDSINLKIRGDSLSPEIELYDCAAYVQLSGTEELVNFSTACQRLIVQMRDALKTQ